MKKITLTEEIGRMFEIMNNNEGMVILESTLLLEQNILSAIKGAEKLLGPIGVGKAETYLEKNAESFGERYSKFFEKNNVSKSGRETLRKFIKDVSSVSPSFAKNFVTKNETFLVELEQEKGTKKFNEIITSSFGEKILNSYRTLHPTSSVGSRAGTATPKPPKSKPPKSKQKSIPIPSELKDSEGVKDFQKWLNDNKPGWFKNKEMEIGGDNNYGRFGKSTSKAWETHQIEYLEKTKPPSDLSTKEQIQDFQDWMDSKHPNWIVDSDGKVRNLSQGKGWGKYDINTSKAWEKYGEKYKKTYGTRQRIRSVDLNKTGIDKKPLVTSKKLSLLEKIFASDTEIIGGIRRYSLLFLDTLTKVMKGEEVVIDDIFGKFITVLDKLKAGGTLADSQTYFRDISISIKALQDGKIDIYSTFVKDIEGVLKSSRKYTEDDIAKVIEQLKQKDFDAFNPENTSWLRRLWGESSWNNFRKTLIDKDLKLRQKLLEIVKRGAMVLTTGAIKLPSEYAKHIIDKGVGRGITDIYLIATFITKVTMPIFLATMGTLFTMVKGFSSGYQNEGVVEEFKDNLEEQYKSVFTFGNTFSELTLPSIIVSAIVPFHFHWFNFLGWLKDTFDNLINGKIFESWNEQAKKFKVALKQEYDKGIKKGKEEKDKIVSRVTNYKDSIINVRDRKIEDLQNQLNNRNNIIDNSEAGFRAWCKLNNYKFKSFSNSVGTTDDGQDWPWNKNTNTFEPY
jgi:hypothetical protein